MKKYIFFFLILICTGNIFGQTPYQGGVGDGYASISLPLQTVSSASEQVHLLKVYPTIASPNEFVRLEALGNFESVTLVDISGKSIVLKGIEFYHLPAYLQSGVYHIIAKDRQQVYYSKIVVVGN